MPHPEPAFSLARPNLPVLENPALLGYRVVIIDMEHGATKATAYVTLSDDLTALHAGLAQGLAMLRQREPQV